MTLSLITFNSGQGNSYESLKRITDTGLEYDIPDFSIQGVNELAYDDNGIQTAREMGFSKAVKTGGTFRRKISRRQSSKKKPSQKRKVSFKIGGGVKSSIKSVPKSPYKAVKRYSSAKIKQDLSSADRARIERDLDRILG